MAHAGGEFAKLGDRYEAIWTVDSLLDVLTGEANWLVVEPFDKEESLGIEFKKETSEALEFHSAKRQTPHQVWSIADLTRLGENGRSVLGDLFAKLELDPRNRVVFVSGTTARDLEEVSTEAGKAKDAVNFESRIDASSRTLRRNFEDRILNPQFGGDLQKTWESLRRTRVVGWTEQEMIRRVEQRIRTTLYRIDGTPLDETASRLLLAEMVLDRFGEKITRNDIVDYLAKHQIAERDWVRERGPREEVERRNAAYVGNVEAELIAEERIVRDEANAAVTALVDGSKKCAVFIGAAGLGKSCAVAQTVVMLKGQGIPTVVLRLDTQTEVLTSRRLGEELGLPESPVLVLAGIANGGRCVLVIDQLDAISFASGRNQRLWQVFTEILEEARNYPQMRVLLACRAFDAENDPRIRRLLTEAENTLRIDIGKLSVEVVHEKIRLHAGIDPASLDAVHTELLRTPLHLNLYLQSDPRSQPQFSGIQDLLGRYWTHKRRLVSQQLGRESRWLEIIRTLVDRLSREQTLSASQTLFDGFDEADIDVIASHNVIVREGDSVRFFHEAFFDYCFARLFAERDQTILELLTEGGREQHLFRRAQVRQILEYERERNYERYLGNLRDLLTSPSIRYHLKKQALDWLGSIPEPKEEEWRLIESLGTSTALGRAALAVPWNRPAWVLLLFRLGVFAQWLEGTDPEFKRTAIGMLSLPTAMKECSKEVAQLLRPFVFGDRPWQEEFANLFSFGEPHHSPEMFELFCEATRRRLFRPPSDREWHRYAKIVREKPDYAIQWLLVLLDLEPETSDKESNQEWIEIKSNFILELAGVAPELFARVVLPRIATKVEGADEAEAKAFRRQLLLRRATTYSADTLTALTRGVEIALGSLARESPQQFDSVVTLLEGRTHEFWPALLLASWSENGSHYANKIVTYLLENPERLGLKMFMWERASAVEAVRSAAPHCSDELYLALEAAIMGYTPEPEKRDPKRNGYHRMLLLECLPPHRISRATRMHFEELKRKFPWAKFDRSDNGVRGGKVRSPVPEQAMPFMTDEQWLEAMRTYASERNRDTSDFLKGGKHELSSALRIKAQIDKPRFAHLALRMEDTIAPDYFSAILGGISTTTQASAGEPKLPESALLPLGADLLLDVIFRIRGILCEECAKNICRAIGSIAENHPPSRAVQIVSNYALNDADPSEEQWIEREWRDPMWGGDPYFQGMNTVRGVAAETLAALLFADERYLEEIRPAMRSVIADRSIAVRSCAMACLVAMLNFDRDQAVGLFLELTDGADPVLDTHYVEQFIYHASFRHYEPLRPVLFRMLESGSKEARAIAGRQIVRAAFHDPTAAEDLPRVLRGDEVCRKAAAEIYAHNLGRTAVQVECRTHLEEFFDDPDAEVRSTAAGCFRLIPSEILVNEQELMFRFIASQACLEHSQELILALEESSDPLPEVICQIPERLIEEQRALGQGEHIESRRWTYHLPALVARLYEQTTDPDVETRCLNIIDGMLELGFSEIEKELAEVER